MSDRKLPEHIDPFRFAEQNLSLHGIVQAADMERLSTTVNTANTEVKVQLTFGIDEQKITYLKGNINTQLNLECQRCMQPFKYEIISDFLLGIVNNLDQANALPEIYEPVLVKDNSLALKDVIEDEIILNLPIIPRHDRQVCAAKLPLTDDQGAAGNKIDNPFKVLESLKGKNKL